MTTAKIPWKGEMVEVVLLPIRPAKGTDPALYLYEEAASAFIEMNQAAKAAGITLTVNTAFRDHEYQKRLYAEYMAAKAAGKSHPVVAVPGTSDHERGLSVDIATGVPEALRKASRAEKAAASPVYKWLYENASKYGFINDVSSEPWHWTHKVDTVRPVGVSVEQHEVKKAATEAAKKGGSALLLLGGIGLAWLVFGRGRG